ncbi:MAG: nucleotidyltransferase family protein [bacterium]
MKVDRREEEARDAIQKIVEMLRDRGANEAYLVGSLADGNFDLESDIDIAVEGVKPEEYFSLLAEVNELGFKVDLIDLRACGDPFADHLRRRGVKLL